MLTAELARELFAYDPESGLLTWRERPQSMFASGRIWASWNARNAGKVAGTPHAEGYTAVGHGRGRKLLAHRVIWLLVTGEWPAADIDHINGDRSDNRLANLRSVSRAENLRNMRLKAANKSGVAGVYWDRNAGKWHAQIRANGTTKYLGLFASLDEAAAVRRAAERAHGYHPNHGRNVA